MPNIASLFTVKTKATLNPLLNGLVKDIWRPLAMPGAAKTISSGAITLAPSDGEGHYTIDTQGSANYDDLDTFSGGSDGDIVYLLQANVARIVKLTTAGNISLPPTGFEICLSATVPVGFRYNGSASKWMLLSFFDPSIELWKNGSGGSVALGDVVIFDKSAAIQFTTTTILADKRVLGVAVETIANGAYGWIAKRGRRRVNLNAAVTVGQALIVSTSAKLAIPNGGATQDGYIGYVVDATDSPTFCIAEIAPRTDRTGGNVTYVSQTNANNWGSGAVTLASGITVSGSNRLLVAIAAQYYTGAFTPTLTSVTWGTQTFALSATVAATYWRLSIFFLVAPDVGTGNVTAASTYTTYGMSLVILFNDVNQSTPVDTGASGSGTSVSPSIACNSTPGDYVGAVLWTGNASVSGGRQAGQANLYDALSSQPDRIVVDATDPATGATTTSTWTISSSLTWFTAAVAIKPL
jgi:hypothetical protein